jgi:hypothetical protein
VHNHNYTKFAFPKNLTTPLQQKNIDHGNSNIITIYSYDTKSPPIVQKFKLNHILTILKVISGTNYPKGLVNRDILMDVFGYLAHPF